MVKKDSRASGDKKPAAKQTVKRESNPSERQRSFARERSAVLRPAEQSGAQAERESSQQSFATGEHENPDPSQGYKEKMSQYRQRQLRASKSAKTALSEKRRK